MSLPGLEARYKGVVTDIALNDKDGKPQVVLGLRCTQIYTTHPERPTEPKKWYDISAKQWEIRAYLHLVKKDNTVNEHAVNQLWDAIQWDSADGLESLQSSQFIGKEVQFLTKNEEYNSATNMKVKWLYKADADPEAVLGKADEETIKKMASTFDSQLAALSKRPKDTSFP